MPVDGRGRYLERSKVTIDIGGVKYDNEVEEVSYAEKSSIKTLPGKGDLPKGRVMGKREFEGKIKFSRDVWDTVVTDMGGPDWRETSVNITVSFGENETAQSDLLEDVILHSPSQDIANDEEPIFIELQLSIMRIVWAGEDAA